MHSMFDYAGELQHRHQADGKLTRLLTKVGSDKLPVESLVMVRSD